MKKGNNSTSKSVKVSKSDITPKKITYLEEYRDCFDWRMKPVTDRFLERFAQDIVEYVRTRDEVLTVEEFCDGKGVQEKTYYRWVEKYPVMQEAHEQALAIIARRREKFGLLQKLNPGFVERSMPIYSKKYRELAEWRSSLTGNANNVTTQPIHVTVEAIPASPKVPEKKSTKSSE